MDESLRLLDERKECPNDTILVQLVKLQLNIERAATGQPQDRTTEAAEQFKEPSSRNLLSSDPHSHASENAPLYQTHTNGRLLWTRRCTGCTYIIAVAILLHTHSTRLDVALPESYHLTKQLTDEEQRSFDASLESTKSWFDIFLTISPIRYPELPFSIMSQLVRAVRCLDRAYQLIARDDPGLGRESLRQRIDPCGILNRVIANIEQAVALAELETSNSTLKDTLSRCAQLFRSRRQGWELKPGALDLSITTASQDENEPFPLDTQVQEYFDDDWLTNFFLPPPNY
jgi:hypothetical protein